MGTNRSWSTSAALFLFLTTSALVFISNAESSCLCVLSPTVGHCFFSSDRAATLMFHEILEIPNAQDSGLFVALAVRDKESLMAYFALLNRTTDSCKRIQDVVWSNWMSDSPWNATQRDRYSLIWANESCGPENAPYRMLILRQEVYYSPIRWRVGKPWEDVIPPTRWTAVAAWAVSGTAVHAYDHVADTSHLDHLGIATNVLRSSKAAQLVTSYDLSFDRTMQKACTTAFQNGMNWMNKASVEFEQQEFIPEQERIDAKTRALYMSFLVIGVFFIVCVAGGMHFNLHL